MSTIPSGRNLPPDDWPTIIGEHLRHNELKLNRNGHQYYIVHVDTDGTTWAYRDDGDYSAIQLSTREIMVFLSFADKASGRNLPPEEVDA